MMLLQEQFDIKVLAVDDEEMNIDVLEEHLKEAGFKVVIARDGVEAMQALQDHKDIKIVVLDRMMPRMDGMEVVRLMKADRHLRKIPIVMQTAAASSAQILEGLQAQVHYYLTKPYSIFKLVSIVSSALNRTADQDKLRQEVFNGTFNQSTKKQTVNFQTLAEARTTAINIAKLCPQPDKVVVGLHELLINAIEHGNLGINYGEKKLLVVAGTWEQEIKERLVKEDFKNRTATLEYEIRNDTIFITISDQGKGFGWQTYLDVIPARMGEPHGRGILHALEAFDGKLEFTGNGNVVICRIVQSP